MSRNRAYLRFDPRVSAFRPASVSHFAYLRFRTAFRRMYRAFPAFQGPGLRIVCVCVSESAFRLRILAFHGPKTAFQILRFDPLAFRVCVSSGR